MPIWIVDSAQRDPDPTGFINPEYRLEVRD
jgi:hypothetical protein